MSGGDITFLSTQHACALAEIHAACFPRPWSFGQIEDGLSSAGAFALAVGAPPVGFVLARVAAGEAEILTIAVLPSCQRRGLAKALMQAAMREARARLAGEMFLEVAADNSAAIAIYSALGFEKTGKRPAYYDASGKNPIDALVMRRCLA